MELQFIAKLAFRVPFIEKVPVDGDTETGADKKVAKGKLAVKEEKADT